MPSRDSEIRGAIARIAKTYTILRRPVNKLFPNENTYQDNNQTDKSREKKLRQKVAVTGELKRKYECSLREPMGAEEYLNIIDFNLLIIFNKTREIFHSVTRVLNILLTTVANSASIEKANFQGRVA